VPDPPREHTVAAPDGRALKVVEDGDPTGVPILAHNGSPNSRLLYRDHVELARRQGIRLISYDRPGYGGSDRQAGRKVADCVHDVRAIAAALEIDRLGVWGISGGGPHAIACAARLADLVPAVAVLASPAPWEAPGFDYFDGMGELNVEDIKLMLEDPTAARAKCHSDREELLSLTAPALTEFMRTLLSPVDASVLTGDLAQHLIDSIQDGLSPGSDGWWDDEVAMLEPWGFDFAEIATPVLLRHGRQDRFVPVAHGEWLAGVIPGVRAEITDDDGHLTLLERHLGSIHDWLLARV